jgi:predicted metal-dependent HD superfamily phosphohydrolase
MTSDGSTKLLARWQAVAGDSEGAVHAGRDLIRRWSEPHRRYHTLVHLKAVLDHLDWLGAADDPARLAAWYHDAIYQPDRHDNEDASAALAERTLLLIGPTRPMARETARLVRLTATHQPAETDLQGRLLCDADLAILGAAPAAYKAYRLAVRDRWEATARANLDDEMNLLGRGSKA